MANAIGMRKRDSSRIATTIMGFIVSP
jgi:hypothetical protein